MKTDFSENLSRLRRETGCSQRQAAEDLGISQALLSHYENGAREPKLEFVSKACDYYGVSADYMLGRSEKRTLDGLYAFNCCCDAELSLIKSLQNINEILHGAGDRDLTVAAVGYLTAAADWMNALLADPHLTYEPVRDAEIKMAEAAFLKNARRVLR